MSPTVNRRTSVVLFGVALSMLHVRAAEIDVTYAPVWGPPDKDIDFYWCETDIAAPACHFEIDQPPETATVTIGTGDQVWMMDDYAGWNFDDLTPQPYTVVVTID